MNEARDRALRKAKNLCAKSEKCAKDIKEKLRQWEIPIEFYEEIIEALYAGKFLDDLRYAESYVHDKIYLSKWGKQKVAFSLRSKDIADVTIQQALQEIDSERYEKGLLELLQKKEKSVKAKSVYEKKAKLIRFGVSRGFSMSEIDKILNEIV
ncbi:MAG: RecX family transcriptional regulator [Bacteroidia bacterium]|nr:MAG: RecX family transcriptional regulator [Bacteroidia bacterium]